ncbi:MAG TPA: GAF domain-containing SpoIIE family protein phosphatase [Terriglobales bacterium]
MESNAAVRKEVAISMPRAALRSPFPPSPAIFQQRRVDALMSLQKVAQEIGSILELDELLDTIVHRIAVDFGCIESSILLIEGEQFHLAAVHGCTQSCKGERWSVSEGLSGQVVITGRPHYAPDVSQELHYRACEPNTRSEIVIPLKVRNRVIGVFNASHHDIDAFPKAQFEMLVALAGHIAVAIDNAQRIRGERREMHLVQKEQDEARRIQQNLLPRSAPKIPGFVLDAQCVPAGAVGGDWYDYIPLPDGRVAIVLADVSGKGMPAALLMSSTRGIVRSIAPLGGPSHVLTRVNQMLLEDSSTERYVTMIYAVLDPAQRTLTFASAGHPWPLLCVKGEVQPLYTDSGTPLGLLPADFTEHTITLGNNFRLLFYTDGVSETMNCDELDFGSSGMLDFLRRNDCSVAKLIKAMDEFRGCCMVKDDATAILLRSA